MHSFANRAKFDSFWTFLKFFLSNHPKPNTEPYSMTQDSTLDTSQGGVLDNFFYPLQWRGKHKKCLNREGFEFFEFCFCKYLWNYDLPTVPKWPKLNSNFLLFLSILVPIPTPPLLLKQARLKLSIF